MEIPSNVFVFDTSEQLALAAAERFVEDAHEAQDMHGRFSVSLAGGKTPRRVYELLTTERFKSRVQWSRVFLFFGDERCVPPTHPDSNYAMAYDVLISRVGIPANNVFRITGEGDPEANAKAYENQLRAFFAPQAWPRFDLVLLGMGQDGHTASIFPDSAALNEAKRWVLATQNDSGQRRITLTIPALNHARKILFMVTGKEKAAPITNGLRGQPRSNPLPASLIRPVEVDATLEWYIDRDAASLL